MHTHTWRIVRYLLLGLPTREGLVERLVAWECPCGQWCQLTAEMRLGLALRTPEFWDAVAQAEQRRGTPEARQARVQRHAARP